MTATDTVASRPLRAPSHHGNGAVAHVMSHVCGGVIGYPITPSTEVMQILSRELPKYGGVVLQAEDEISGVGAT